MRQYNRAKQKMMDLTSVNEYTSHVVDEQTSASCRSNQREVVPDGGRNDGAKGNKPGRGRKTNWGRTPEHQQGDAQEEFREHRLSAEDSGEHRTRSGIKDAAQEIGEAA